MIFWPVSLYLLTKKCISCLYIDYEKSKNLFCQQTYPTTKKNCKNFTPLKVWYLCHLRTHHKLFGMLTLSLLCLLGNSTYKCVCILTHFAAILISLIGNMLTNLWLMHLSYMYVHMYTYVWTYVRMLCTKPWHRNSSTHCCYIVYIYIQFHIKSWINQFD